MPTIVKVTHRISGVRRDNRVRVETGDESKAADEIRSTLGATYGCDASAVAIEKVESDKLSVTPTTEIPQLQQLPSLDLGDIPAVNQVTDPPKAVSTAPQDGKKAK